MPKGEYLQYGGQAVIEGVMMRSPDRWAVACRAPNGKIVLHSEPLEKTWIGKQRWLRAPFLRGSLGILDAIALGTKAMRFSSEVQLDDKYRERTPSEARAPEFADGVAATDNESRNGEVTEVFTPEGSHVIKPHPPTKSSLAAQVTFTLVIGFALGIMLFGAFPNWIAELTGRLGITNPTAKNLVAELVKIGVFLGYIGLIGLMKDIREVFKYHGAEHKAINALEADQPLTLQNALAQTRLHPRCGTSFAIVVLILSLLIFTFVPRYPLGESQWYPFNVAVRVLVELALLPLVAGIAYESIRIAGRFRNQMWVKAAFAPGLATQFLTTREPEPDKVEVALAALRAVVEPSRSATEGGCEPTVEVPSAQATPHRGN